MRTDRARLNLHPERDHRLKRRPIRLMRHLNPGLILRLLRIPERRLSLTLIQIAAARNLDKRAWTRPTIHQQTSNNLRNENAHLHHPNPLTPTPTPNQTVVAERASQTNNHLASDNLRTLHPRPGQILASLHPSPLLLLLLLLLLLSKTPTHQTKITLRRVRVHLPQSQSQILTPNPNLSLNPERMQLEIPLAAAVKIMRSKHPNKTRPPRDRNPNHP